MSADSPHLIDTGRGLSIHYRGHNLYSPTSPVGAAERRALAYSVPPQTLLFVPSPLLFYGVELLVSRCPPDAHLLCIEADQRLMKLSIDNVPQTLLHHPRVTYLRTDSIDAVLGSLHALGVGSYRRCIEVTLNAGSAANRSLYARMFRALEYEIRSYWQNRMTLMQLSHLWLKNFFLNLPELARSRDLAELSIEKPIVVTAAGESLEGALPVLASLRSRFYLLAVDTAAGTLGGYGLRPDALMVLDAQAANFQDLIGIDTDGVALVSDLSAYPGCIRRFDGERWFFVSEFAPLELFSRARAAGLLPMALPPLGSVGITALYSALALTRAPVLFAGLDFSYLPGKSHARGAPTHIASLLRTGRLSPPGVFASTIERPHRPVSDKTGRTVWTNGVLAGYGSALDLFLASTNRVYDLGKTGLPTAAPRLADAEAVAAVLDRPNAEPETDGAAGRPRNHLLGSARAGDAVAGFLRSEHERLLATVDRALDALRQRKTGEDASQELRRAILELDYVYLHFPDWREEPELSESFLKRFVEAAETRAVWVERAAELAKEVRPREG